MNDHSEGLGGGISICENGCGCVYCEFDYEGTITFNYFQGSYDNWYITKMTTDAKQFWSITHGGIPYMKEPMPLTVKEKRQD